MGQSRKDSGSDGRADGGDGMATLHLVCLLLWARPLATQTNEGETQDNPRTRAALFPLGRNRFPAGATFSEVIRCPVVRSATHETGAATCQGHRGTGFAGPPMSPPRGGGAAGASGVFHFRTSSSRSSPPVSIATIACSRTRAWRGRRPTARPRPSSAGRWHRRRRRSPARLDAHQRATSSSMRRFSAPSQMSPQGWSRRGR